MAPLRAIAGTSGVVTSTYDSATGTWSVSGAIADVNALLAAVTFTPAENFNGSFSIATSVSDDAGTATGSKLITDFEEGKKGGDVIEFDHKVFADFAAVLANSAEDASGNVVITTPGGANSITLLDVPLANLNVHDFQFV